MDLNVAETLARHELHRLPQLVDWSFGWNRRCRVHGLYRYDRRKLWSARGLADERALMLAELYRKDGGWRLSATGQGRSSRLKT